jgi:hypothetical protein
MTGQTLTGWHERNQDAEADGQVGTIYLRQRGSAESKPVHAPHADMGR